MFRDLVMDGVFPDFIQFGIILVISILVLVLGVFVFYKKQDTFILDL